MSNILKDNIKTLEQRLEQYIEFRSNSIMYKDLNSPEDFEKILENTDIMSCIKEELEANIKRQTIELYMNEIEREFKEVDSYKLIYTAMKNHYLSLTLNEEIQPEEPSSQIENNSTEVTMQFEDIPVDKAPENPDLYGAEFLKG